VEPEAADLTILNPLSKLIVLTAFCTLTTNEQRRNVPELGAVQQSVGESGRAAGASWEKGRQQVDCSDAASRGLKYAGGDAISRRQVQLRLSFCN
jgi:hypothetical protein